MFKMWIEILLCFVLAVCALTDARKKQIPLVPVWLGILAATALRLGGVIEEDLAQAFFALVPGAAFFALSFVTGEKVGYGDGWVLLMVGLFLGFPRCFLILLIGLLLQSAVALVLLVYKKAHRNLAIPFSPFLFLGMGVVLFL